MYHYGMLSTCDPNNMCYTLNPLSYKLRKSEKMIFFVSAVIIIISREFFRRGYI